MATVVKCVAPKASSKHKAWSEIANKTWFWGKILNGGLFGLNYKFDDTHVAIFKATTGDYNWDLENASSKDIPVDSRVVERYKEVNAEITVEGPNE